MKNTTGKQDLLIRKLEKVANNMEFDSSHFQQMLDIIDFLDRALTAVKEERENSVSALEVQADELSEIISKLENELQSLPKLERS